jgi:hypothetical protein
LLISAVLAGSLLLVMLWKIASTTNLGGDDFVAYWSSTYLFHNGQNPYNPELMRITQDTQVQSDLGFTIMTWNPPTLFVFLLPLAWFSFTTAKFIWLIVNLAMVLAANLMLARLYIPPGSTRLTLAFLVFATILPQVISGIFMGQVTFLVFIGVVACMALIKNEQWFWAGAVLIFTTVKPHVANLSVIYLLIFMAQNRRYQGWGGLFLAGTTCLVILFAFRPYWINDFMGLLTVAPTHWSTPTIGGLLSYLRISDSFRYIIVLLLPLPFLLARQHNRITVEFAVALLTLITIPVTFYGWSYDQTILLIPIAQVFGWIARSKNRTFNTWIAVAMAYAFAASYYQRSFVTNDLYYVWIPLFWWLIFGLAWRYISAPINSPN